MKILSSKVIDVVDGHVTSRRYLLVKLLVAAVLLNKVAYVLNYSKLFLFGYLGNSAVQHAADHPNVQLYTHKY